jgi:hypothetical protein
VDADRGAVAGGLTGGPDRPADRARIPGGAPSVLEVAGRASHLGRTAGAGATCGGSGRVNVTANSTRFNTSLNIDGITADIDFSDTSQFRNVKASIDPINLQGDPSDQEITGGNSGEFIRGRAGQDTLDGGTATTSSSATRT